MYNEQDWIPVILSKPKPNLKVHNENNKNNKTLVSEDEIVIIPKISQSNSILIKTARNNMKLTQKQLAKQISIDSQTLQAYESGKAVPDFKIMLKLEKILKIKLNKKKIQ